MCNEQWEGYLRQHLPFQTLSHFLSLTLPFSHPHPFTLSGIILTLSDTSALKFSSCWNPTECSLYNPHMLTCIHMYTHTHTPPHFKPFSEIHERLEWESKVHGFKGQGLLVHVLKQWCVTTSSGCLVMKTDVSNAFPCNPLPPAKLLSMHFHYRRPERPK